jgi:3-oxoacyl-[acyl-carrier protein] reductase
MLLKGKKVIVSGGTRGIGEAIVRAMVDQGALVAFTYLQSEEKAIALQHELGMDKVLPLQCNGSQSTQVNDAFNKAIAFLGGLDVLVNNAGITKDSLLLRMNEDDWNDVIQTNLTSVFLFSKLAVKQMLRTGGSIINISSIIGQKGNAGQANYAASKAGIIGFSKSLSKEMGSRNIRCNVIAPGFITTEMTQTLPSDVIQQYLNEIPLKRMGRPNEVAQTAVFLASEMSSYVSGQVISVCGGIS